jgi:ankyrin repeat protein
MKKQQELLLYQAIEEHDFDLFLKTIGDHDLQWLNSVLYGDIFDIITPLELAIEVSNQPVVVKILSMGEDPSSYINTAIVAGDVNVVKLLFDAGAKVEDAQESLYLAGKGGNLEILKFLIDSGVDFNNCDEQTTFTDWVSFHPLVITIAYGHLHVYEYLTKFNNVDEIEILNTVALHEVARRGNIEALQLLLDRGIDVNSTHYLLEGYNAGYTALMSAVSTTQLQMIEYLISVGAGVNLQDDVGQTALMIAVNHGSMILVKKLLATGAYKDLKDCNGNIALDLAINRQDKILVKLLK